MSGFNQSGAWLCHQIRIIKNRLDPGTCFHLRGVPSGGPNAGVVITILPGQKGISFYATPAGPMIIGGLGPQSLFLPWSCDRETNNRNQENAKPVSKYCRTMPNG